VPGPRLLAAVLVGGVLGGMARYGVTSALPAGDGFPWATWWVNVGGSFLLALILVVALETLRAASHVRALLGTGFCGAFTTFSGVTVTTSELARDGALALSAAYLSASLLGAVVAGAAGLVAGRLAVQGGR